MGLFSLRPFSSPVMCTATNGSHTLDASFIKRAANLADKSACFTAPHPNFGCVIAVNSGTRVPGEGYLHAQGTKPAELQAVEAAGEYCKGATAYVNMESGDCHSDSTVVSSFIKGGITRVVVGIRHPLQHLRGSAIRTLRSEGLQVDVLGEDLQSKTIEEALKPCLLVNAPLLYRAACRVPYSVLKYAMTLDGKIAASSGHASWISSRQSRGLVLALRGRSDAIIVGGNTVRKDNPRLTARHGGGHMHLRLVMSQSLDLPEVANLWDVADDKNIGREKVYAFVAPKIIGGKNAPSPVGELGMVEMTQALELSDVCYEQIGPDMLISGFLQPVPDLTPSVPSMDESSAIDPSISPYDPSVIFFYKAWDPYGAFSNFSHHPIHVPDDNGDYITWSSVEHYYQAHKFMGMNDPEVGKYIEDIVHAKSPEEAARKGRKLQRQRPDLVRPDWENVKVDIMYKALKYKFSIYPHLNSILLSTSGSVLVEASPQDLFWGGGREGEGMNYLGRLLMQLRSEFLGEIPSSGSSTVQTEREIEART